MSDWPNDPAKRFGPYEVEDEELRQLREQLRKAEIEDEKRRLRERIRKLKGGMYLA